MADQMNREAPSWSAGSAKTKTAVQRSVTALLDELAPQRTLKRVEELPGPIEQHRAPNGCVLQAPTCAVSISWFADATEEAALGELHVRVWQGRVTRRGGHRAAKNAVMISELVLRPIESPLDNYLWRTTDGKLYDVASLAANCSALLAAQISAPEQTGAAPR